MKLGIVGSREWKDFDFMRTTIDSVLAEFPDINMVISGGARGVDREAVKYARQRGLAVIEYKPDFSQGYHRNRYIERNEIIAKESDLVLAFWDERSPGTKSTIDFCDGLKKECRIYTPPHH